jgi:arylsulfate sulfotransferase
MQQPPPPPPPQITGVSVAPQSVAIAAGATTQFTATVTGDSTNSVTWSVNGVAGGNSTTGTIDASGNYTAPQGTGVAATITATSTKDTTKSGNASAKGVVPGTYVATNNTQVVQYTVTAPADAKVSVEFGLDTNYGTPTWQQATPAGGGAVSLFVAGMKANTTYHMRGVVAFNDGTIFNDADHTFAVPSLPTGVLPTITTTTATGASPQSGVEVLDFAGIGSSLPQGVVVTDLSGNVLWTYYPTMPAGVSPNPIKLLPNGHFLINFNAQPDGTDSVLQEVDLGGDVVWQMTAADLNNALAAATCPGCHISVDGTHHDFVALPNGHLILLASLTQSGIQGDVVIDLDQNHKPVWISNEFNYLQTSRAPFGLPDWTHTNAILYSKDDGNLIISSRHQSWLMKLDYQNGAGTGNLIWKMGFQGDFSLVNGTDPTDWFFAQHGPSFVSTNTSGNFTLVLFDNGNNRMFPGGLCGTSGQPACYSTVEILQVDESAKTATIQFNPTTPEFSFFGGNAEVLPNGNVEFTEASSTPLPANNGKVYEMTQTNPPQTVWQMQVGGIYIYRGFRMPSLYPGVQW